MVIIIVVVIAATEGALLLTSSLADKAQIEIVSWTHAPNPYVSARVESFNFELVNTGDAIGQVAVECNVVTGMFVYLVRYSPATVYPSQTLTLSVYVMMPDSDRTAIISADVSLIPI